MRQPVCAVSVILALAAALVAVIELQPGAITAIDGWSRIAAPIIWRPLP